MSDREHWLQSYEWLCRQRRHWPSDSDVWDLRWRWDHPQWQECDALYAKVTKGQYRLSPLQIVVKDSNIGLAVWSSRDALVLKWLTLTVTHWFPVHPACRHIKSHGGVAKSRQDVLNVVRSPEYSQCFIWRTDIKGYYRHITGELIQDRLLKYLPGRNERDLVMQFTEISAEDGGEYFTPRGITRGCALSPLIGGALLCDVDVRMSALATLGVYYIRYMDDVLVLAPKRHAMRRARQVLLDEMDNMGFSMHPDKTQVGRLPGTRFDWLGWEFDGGTVRPAVRAWQHHLDELKKRREESMRTSRSEAETEQRLAQYRRRWQAWLQAGALTAPIVLTRDEPTNGEV